MADQLRALENRDIGPLSVRALIRPNSVDREARTFELTWTTGAAARRYSWSKGEFIEELSLKRSHVRLKRLKNRAPVLDSHNAWSLGSVLGVVETARIDNDSEGVAKVRFPKEGIDEDADRVFEKVADGIITHSSVGYRVYKYEITEEEGQLPVYRATDWEPYELSMVPMGVDDDATVRAEKSVGEERDTNQCEFVLVHRGAAMGAEKRQDKEVIPAPPTPAEQAPKPAERAESTEDITARAKAAEKARIKAIKHLARACEIDDDVAAKWIEDDVSIEDARALAIDLRAEQREKDAPVESIRGTVRVEGGEDLRRAAADAGVENAILHRYKPEVHELSDAGRLYRAMTDMEMARAYLDARGFRTAGMTRHEIAAATMGNTTRGAGGQHSTSDFPLILANTAVKELRRDYDNTPQTFRAWCSSGTIPDFKPVDINQLGDFPTLDPVLEGAEYTYGTIGEAQEQMRLSKYGKLIAFTWEMLVNDDLDAFMRLAARIGFATANLESDLVYNHFNSNPVMGDGVTLFHANHLNVGTGAISIAGLSSGRAAMRQQRGLNNRRINVMAKYLLVPTTLETVAEQNVSDVQATEVTNKNVFAGKLTPITEPRLDDASTLEWNLAADPSQVETLRYATLRGESGPIVTSQTGFEVDGVVIKVKHTFAVKAIDHRGLYQSTGV